jgi:hypothetical protein
MIVDNKHDLNVYNDAQADGAKNTCCGKGKSKKTAASDVRDGSMSPAKDIDFNEWAGTWDLEQLVQYAIANKVCRFVPDLCDQIISLTSAF